MGRELIGYRIESCFSRNGCSNRVVDWDDFSRMLERKLSERNLKAFLKDRVKGPLKMHHEFRVSISDCPNACSRPQIADIGLLGAQRPRVTPEECIQCKACIEICQEKAISLEEDVPFLNHDSCLSCGQCLSVCPTGTLQEDARGYRILIGGKLGRHPQLGSELPGIYKKEEALKVFDRCLVYYQKNCLEGERFGRILERMGLGSFTGEIKDIVRVK